MTTGGTTQPTHNEKFHKTNKINKKKIIMSDDLNPAILKRTQDILGKYIKKPSLTEKLLRKPPFRFLYDVFSVIIRDTRCFVGLYSLQELTYENIKDRDDKIRFLQKMIDVVKLTTGSNLTIKTSKIVAGHEPEKTNELLQLMGDIIEKQLDWKRAVEQVVSGNIPGNESPSKSKETTNKPTKDNTTKGKLQEKLKEKTSNVKDSKTTKAPDARSKTLTATKDDKIKRSKPKENNTKQLAAKERTTKANKEELEKSLKKSIQDSSNKKSKLKKADSQSSNKDMPTLNSQEATKEPVSIENETNDIHPELEHQTENSKLSPNKLLNFTEVSRHNQNDTLQTKSLSAEKLNKSSAKLRTPSAEKSSKNSVRQAKEKDKEISLNTENLEVSENDNNIVVKHDPLSIGLEPEIIGKQAESNDPNVNQTERPDPIQRTIHKPKHISPPSSSSNELKRESTFTREKSIDSNKGSLVNRPRTSLRPPSARPPSARPGAPRRRDKNIEIILQPNDQIKMSGIQVKLETFGDLDDDGENLVIIENSIANESTLLNQEIGLTESEKIMQDETVEQGHLVQQILETQKELVQHQTDTGSQQKNDKESSNNSVMRQTSALHIDNLRDVIQNITKSVNPLGKLMDFIPEDIDAMQLEFTLWRDSYVQAANELKREKSLTESAIEPMKNQLVQIEANITEYDEMIDASRVKILQNSEKILKLLTN